jgi:uncharacterized protein
LERILRVVRPYKGYIVVKESGMHAVEDYLMSRYQMYWQVYFHPVTRSAEILLQKIFGRAKHLYEEKFPFNYLLNPLEKLFLNQLSENDYFLLDESFMQTMLMFWSREEDPVLADLCSRFLHRRLFKYTTQEQPSNSFMLRLAEIYSDAGYDPAYYMAVDFSSDLSYDVYRPGENDEKLPIYLLDGHEELTEISVKSDIVSSISGLHMGKHHIYYPEELLSRVNRIQYPDIYAALAGKPY